MIITETIQSNDNLATLAATEANNEGTTNLATAWTNRASLIYA